MSGNTGQLSEQKSPPITIAATQETKTNTQVAATHISKTTGEIDHVYCIN
jgi:hypothetical protein